jgi:hypothetical protein
MTMDQKPRDPEWAALCKAWQEQDEKLLLPEHELRSRLRRRRLLLAGLAMAEAASLALVLGSVAYMACAWITTPGASPILIVFVLLYAGVLLRLRLRHRAAIKKGVLEGVDASTEREERLLESMRLGAVMGMIALAGMIVAIVMSPGHYTTILSPAPLTVMAALSVYVFGLQVALLVWGAQVRRRRRKLEAIRRALQPPEVTHE